MLERKKQHTTSAFNRKAKLLNKNKKNPGTEKSIIKSMQAPRGWINDRKRCVAYGICFYVFFFSFSIKIQDCYILVYVNLSFSLFKKKKVKLIPSWLSRVINDLRPVFSS